MPNFALKFCSEVKVNIKEISDLSSSHTQTLTPFSSFFNGEQNVLLKERRVHLISPGGEINGRNRYVQEPVDVMRLERRWQKRKKVEMAGSVLAARNPCWRKDRIVGKILSKGGGWIGESHRLDFLYSKARMRQDVWRDTEATSHPTKLCCTIYREICFSSISSLENVDRNVWY